MPKAKPRKRVVRKRKPTRRGGYIPQAAVTRQRLAHEMKKAAGYGNQIRMLYAKAPGMPFSPWDNDEDGRAIFQANVDHYKTLLGDVQHQINHLLRQREILH